MRPKAGPFFMLVTSASPSLVWGLVEIVQDLTSILPGHTMLPMTGKAFSPNPYFLDFIHFILK